MTADNVVGLVSPCSSSPTSCSPSCSRRGSDDRRQLAPARSPSSPLVAAGARLLGPYLAGVFGDGDGAAGDRVVPARRAARSTGSCGIDEEREQRWNVYALSLLAFSFVSVRVPVRASSGSRARCRSTRPTSARVPVPLAWNTAVSFVTNTNWQNYGGESTMSHLTQMAGLAVQNFVSPVVGICVAVALIRGLARRRAGTVGNFWVDLVRGTVRLMLPLAVVVHARAREPGRHPEPARLHRRSTTVEGAQPGDPGRAVRQPGGDQGARHQRRRARSTPTRRTRSRTPTGSPTCSRSS